MAKDMHLLAHIVVQNLKVTKSLTKTFFISTYVQIIIWKFLSKMFPLHFFYIPLRKHVRAEVLVKLSY